MAKPQKAKHQSPGMAPPGSRATVHAFGGAPSMLPGTMLEQAIAAREPGPTLVPPTEVDREELEEGIAAWHNNKKISALWSDQANGNSWIAIAGLGWKKIDTASDSAVVSMTMMAAHAEQMNASVNVRLDSNGTVQEIYVW